MLYVRLIIVLGICAVLTSWSAFASDGWLCETDSSQIEGNSLIACGVGEGRSESDARNAAFKNAKLEFNEVCGPGTECADHKYSVEPKRATCERIDMGWKCYRSVVFRVKEAPRKEVHNAGIIAQQSGGTVKVESEDLQDRLVNQMVWELNHYGGPQ